MILDKFLLKKCHYHEKEDKKTTIGGYFCAVYLAENSKFPNSQVHIDPYSVKVLKEVVQGSTVAKMAKNLIDWDFWTYKPR